jgi:hypothetical protein
VPNVLTQEFVSVFSSCTEAFAGTTGIDKADAELFAKIETPDALKSIGLVPLFTIVITVPIGNATDAFVGIVIVCAPVLAE